jgi:hypothetical protein
MTKKWAASNEAILRQARYMLAGSKINDNVLLFQI